MYLTPTSHLLFECECVSVAGRAGLVIYTSWPQTLMVILLNVPLPLQCGDCGHVPQQEAFLFLFLKIQSHYVPQAWPPKCYNYRHEPHAWLNSHSLRKGNTQPKSDLGVVWKYRTSLSLSFPPPPFLPRKCISPHFKWCSRKVKTRREPHNHNLSIRRSWVG